MKVLRFVLRSVGGLWSALMILLMVMSLTLSVTMTMVPAVFAAVSGVVGAAASAVGVKRPTVAKLLAEKEKFLISESDKLKRQLASPEVEYRGTRKPVREAVADTSKRIANRIKFAATRNIVFTAGEALPFVGVATIAAATAWELSDSCKLLEDMSALDAAFNEDNPIDPSKVCGMTAPSAEGLWAGIKSAPSDVWDGMKHTVDWFPELDPADLPDWGTVKTGLNGVYAKTGTALKSGADVVGSAVQDAVGSAAQKVEEIGSSAAETLKGLPELWFGGVESKSDQSQ